MKRVLAILGVLMSMLPAPVFASDWSTYQKDNSHNGIVSSASISDNLLVQWYKQPTLNKFMMPVYRSGIFYFVEYSSGVNPKWLAYAVSKASGKRLWETEGAGVISPNTGLSVDEKYLILPSQKLTALDMSTGRIVWEISDRSDTAFTYSVIDSGVVYAASKQTNSSSYCKIFAVSLETGSVIWSKQLTATSIAPLGIYKGDLIITYGYGSGTGVARWRSSDGSQVWNPYSIGYNFTGPVVIDDERGFGFLSNVHGNFSQINLESGAKVKEIVAGTGTTVPVLLNGKAYYFDNSSGPKAYWNCYDYVGNTVSTRKKIGDDVNVYC